MVYSAFAFYPWHPWHANHLYDKLYHRGILRVNNPVPLSPGYFRELSSAQAFGMINNQRPAKKRGGFHKARKSFPVYRLLASKQLLKIITIESIMYSGFKPFADTLTTSKYLIGVKKFKKFIVPT